jgi:hypothetical protein
MKKLLSISICFYAGLLAAQAPATENPWVFGIHGGFNQFKGDIGNGWYAHDQAAYSFGGFSVSHFLNRNWDLTFYGSRGDLGYRLPWTETGNQNDFRVRKTTASLWARYYFLGNDRFFQPFVFAGGSVLFQAPQGDNHYADRRAFDIGAPEGGIGFNLRLTRWMRFQVQEIFTYTSADYLDYRVGGMNDANLMHSAGLIFSVPRFKVNKGADGPDLVVDKCPPLPKELAAKKAAKKRARSKAKHDKTRP